MQTFILMKQRRFLFVVFLMLCPMVHIMGNTEIPQSVNLVNIDMQLQHNSCTCDYWKPGIKHKSASFKIMNAVMDIEQKYLYLDFSYPVENVEISVVQNGMQVINDNLIDGQTSFGYDLSEYSEGEYLLTVVIGDNKWVGSFFLFN